MYGAGLRIYEVHRLRVLGFEFDNEQLYIGDSKGGKDRASLFPRILHEAMGSQLEEVREFHQRDLYRPLIASTGSAVRQTSNPTSTDKGPESLH